MNSLEQDRLRHVRSSPLPVRRGVGVKNSLRDGVYGALHVWEYSDC